MSKYDFLKQKDGEDIILVVRQHYWIFFITIVEIIILLAVYSLVLFYLKGNSAIGWISAVVIVLFLYVIIRAWFIWDKQVYVITSDRVIVADQSGWFGRTIGESMLENILFINHNIKGPIKTMFNFGDVHLRASGVTEDELVLHNVSNPYNIQQIIVKAQRTRTGSRELKNENEINQKVLIR